MKAVVYTHYGPPDVLHMAEMERPAPKANEVLVRVRATTVTRGDIRMRSFTVPLAMWIPARLYLGVFRPKRPVLGMELAGVVESVGAEVTEFRPGDTIFASTFEASFGGYAEYKCLPADGVIAIKPANLTCEEAAAAVGGGITALGFLQDARLQSGRTILIYGASGAVGSNAVQLACHHFGATVTAVCSTANLEWVRGLGAATVLDYTTGEFAAHTGAYDVVFDAVGKAPPSSLRRLLKPDGVYLNVHKDARSVKTAALRLDALRQLKTMIEAGEVRPVIDRTYLFSQIVDAHRYVELGHKKGNVAITVP
jgi:NADPH:quinone reductase-like Zn-dependent oxidoreductase